MTFDIADPKSGRPFYHNMITGESVWEIPSRSPPPPTRPVETSEDKPTVVSRPKLKEYHGGISSESQAKVDIAIDFKDESKIASQRGVALPLQHSTTIRHLGSLHSEVANTPEKAGLQTVNISVKSSQLVSTETEEPDMAMDTLAEGEPAEKDPGDLGDRQETGGASALNQSIRKDEVPVDKKPVDEKPYTIEVKSRGVGAGVEPEEDNLREQLPDTVGVNTVAAQNVELDYSTNMGVLEALGRDESHSAKDVIINQSYESEAVHDKVSAGHNMQLEIEQDKAEGDEKPSLNDSLDFTEDSYGAIDTEDSTSHSIDDSGDITHTGDKLQEESDNRNESTDDSGQ